MKREIALIASIVLGGAAVFYKCRNFNTHEEMAFLFFADIICMWLPLLIAFIIAIFAYLRYRKNKVQSDLLTSILPLIFLTSIFIIGLFEENESENPILFQASNGDVVGGLSIELKSGDVYTILDFGGIGYEWTQGKYKIENDTIILSGPTDVIANKLIVKRDARKHPVSLSYRDKVSNDLHENELKIVADSIFH